MDSVLPVSSPALDYLQPFITLREVITLSIGRLNPIGKPLLSLSDLIITIFIQPKHRKVECR